MSVGRECCVLSGRGLCDGLIPRPEESYRVSVIRYNSNPLPSTYTEYVEVRLKLHDLSLMDLRVNGAAIAVEYSGEAQ